MTTTNNIFDTLVHLIDTKPTISNIVPITIRLMEAIEQYTELTGSQKKQLVVDVLKHIVNSSDLNEKEKVDILFIIETTCYDLIDSIIAATKGELRINVKISTIRKVFEKLIGLCIKT